MGLSITHIVGISRLIWRRFSVAARVLFCQRISLSIAFRMLFSLSLFLFCFRLSFVNELKRVSFGLNLHRACSFSDL